MSRSHPGTVVPVASPPRAQRGLTFISLVLVLAVITMIGIAVFRLLPLYLADFKVVGALESVSEEFDGLSTSPTELRRALNKRFDIDMIEHITVRDIQIERGKGEYLLVADYAREVPYVANVYLKVKFDHRVSIRFGG